jgi:hypothetical protein
MELDSIGIPIFGHGFHGLHSINLTHSHLCNPCNPCQKFFKFVCVLFIFMIKKHDQKPQIITAQNIADRCRII